MRSSTLERSLDGGRHGGVCHGSDEGDQIVTGDGSGPDADTLLEQLRTRATDPDRRTDVGPPRFSLRGLFGGRAELSPPATPADLRSAERELEITFPPFLARLYTEVADGGFGPGSGLLPLAGLLKRTRILRIGEELPRRRRWPKPLVPLVQLDPGWTCVDLATGAVIDWDPLDLTEWASAERFRESFSERSPSLEAWLSRWVTRKTAADRNKPSAKERWKRIEARGRTPAARASQARKSMTAIAQMSAAERSEMGLPEEGWQEVVRGWFDDSSGE